MKMKDLAKQIKYGKIYNYKKTDARVHYVVPMKFMEKHGMVFVHQLDTNTDGYMMLKGFIDAYRLVEEYDRN